MVGADASVRPDVVHPRKVSAKQDGKFMRPRLLTEEQVVSGPNRSQSIVDRKRQGPPHCNCARVPSAYVLVFPPMGFCSAPTPTSAIGDGWVSRIAARTSIATCERPLYD